MSDDPKADLKARLGLKSRGGAQAGAGPIVPGAPPPEPDKPKGPTQATIEEAKRHAAEADKAAGPAMEQFQFGAPEKTPLPGALPRRVEYVEVKGSEELPEAAKKRRLTLIMAVAASFLVAFFFGRMAGGSSARSAFNESVILEAKNKQELLDSKQATFDGIAIMRAALEKVDGKVKALDPEKGDITTLEADFADLIGTMAKFANNKQSSLDPAEIMGTNIVNGELMRELITFAYQTRFFHESVNGAVEEAMAMFQANPMPPPEAQKMFAIAEPDTIDVEGLGKVPLTKGSIVAQAGRAEPVQSRDAAGNPVTEFYQKVRVEGRAEPVTIKSTQMVQIDMSPFFAKTGKATKRTVLARLAVIAGRLYEQSKKLDPKPMKTAIKNVTDKAGD